MTSSTKETLVSILEYEQTVRNNETVNDTLVENDPTRSVANLIATTAFRDDQAEELRTRERELAETESTFDATLDSLARNPNASIRPAFEDVNANTSINLTETEYALFTNAVEERRAATDENATTDGQNGTGDGDGNVTQRILAEEYAALSEDKQRLSNLAPSLSTQIDELRSLNESQVDGIATNVLTGNTSRSTQALAFMPDYYERGSTETNATLLVVSQETSGGSFAPGDAPDEIEDSQVAMTDLAPDDDSMSVLIYGDGIVSTEIIDSMVDSVLLVGPLAVAFVLLVLVVVYRGLARHPARTPRNRPRPRVDVRCNGVVRHRVQPAVHRRSRSSHRAFHRLRAPRRDALPRGPRVQ